MGRYSAGDKKRNINTNPTTKSLTEGEWIWMEEEVEGSWEEWRWGNCIQIMLYEKRIYVQ